jgi:aromatic-L-amino-acid/L-tryptophan decarboxylase
MNKPIEALRAACAAPLPHPDFDTLRNFGDQIAAWVWRHHETLPEQRLGRTATRPEMEARLREPPPELGQDFARVFAEFQEKVAPFAMRVNHPRFAAFIPGTPNLVSILGDWLCAGVNFFCGVWLEAAGPTQVELVVLDWFKEFLGYPAEARGILTSGGSEANLTALVTAREHLSFADRGRAVLYQTEHRHWSMDRAARVIGMHPDQVRAIPADAQYRLRADALARAIADDRRQGKRPWAVVANAGATNTGTVDPLEELVDLCRREHLWLHVDAAYGWPAVLTEEGRSALRGIEWAASITLDPHKWFGQTFEAGCLLVRDGPRLGQAFSLRPDYMQDVTPNDDEINFADHGIALTRRFRALKIWFSVKVLGVAWYRTLIEHCCRLADLGQLLLEETGKFEILSPRQLSIVAFRYAAQSSRLRNEADLNRLNQAIFDELLADGRAFLSTTRLAGRVALRLCFVNWRTTAADVEQIVRLLVDIGDRLSH